jgi:hypothetical protein
LRISQHIALADLAGEGLHVGSQLRAEDDLRF